MKNGDALDQKRNEAGLWGSWVAVYEWDVMFVEGEGRKATQRLGLREEERFGREGEDERDAGSVWRKERCLENKGWRLGLGEWG